jgi:purine-binding chemotaxis protein CheW
MLDLIHDDHVAEPGEGDLLDTTHTLLTFCLAGQKLAVMVAQVREILDLQPVARVPNARRDVVGVIDVRGEGVAMVDLADQFGMMGADVDAEARIIVLDLPGADGQRRVVGFQAERVLDVVDVSPDAIEPVPVSTSSGFGGASVIGMTRLRGELFMIVDLQALLAPQQQDMGF